MWPPSCSGPASGCSTESSPSGSSRSRCSTLRSPRTSATASVAERRRRGDPGPHPARPFTLHDKNGPTKRAKWCSTASSPDRLPGPHPFGDLGPVEPEPRRVRWSRPFHAPSLPSERRTGRLPSLELRGQPESRYASHTLRRGFAWTSMGADSLREGAHDDHVRRRGCRAPRRGRKDRLVLRHVLRQPGDLRPRPTRRRLLRGGVGRGSGGPGHAAAPPPGDRRGVLRPGRRFGFLPKGLEHAFWNGGTTEARLLSTVSPPGFEGYFEELAEGLAAAGDDEEAARSLREELSETYDIEVVGPPMRGAN